MLHVFRIKEKYECGSLHKTGVDFSAADTVIFSFQEVLQPGKLQGVLAGLREIIITPIKPFSPPPSETTQGASYTQTLTTEQPQTSVPPHPDDLASRITRVLGKGEKSYLLRFALLQIEPKTC